MDLFIVTGPRCSGKSALVKSLAHPAEDLILDEHVILDRGSVLYVPRDDLERWRGETGSRWRAIWLVSPGAQEELEFRSMLHCRRIIQMKLTLSPAAVRALDAAVADQLATA